ncbi:MAG: c-type cytochrome biogenesis protein CcmI, partial [Caulobacteraceae bacterium]
MFLFWITAALLGAGAASLIVWRAAWASKSATEADPAIEVYRRALTEIDDLADRGMIVADERRTARAETGRRLLAEAERPASPVDARLGP